MMNDYAKRIKDKLDIVTIDRANFNILCKDRLDFGFDSIYFRYAEALDELATYKAIVEKIDPVLVRKQLSHRKMHFYNVLEQLLHAHDQEDEDGTYC